MKRERDNKDKNIRIKTMALVRHVSSCEFFGLDTFEKFILYLFFDFLSLEDRNKAQNAVSIQTPSYETMTELAFRAKWMEREYGMEEYEVYSFIISLRNKLFPEIKDAAEVGYGKTAEAFFAPFGHDMDEEERGKMFSFLWEREVSGHLDEEEMLLGKALLDIEDGDYVYIKSKYIPGLFLAIAEDKDCDVLFSIENERERVLLKMLLLMTLPLGKCSRYKVSDWENVSMMNKREGGREFPDKVIFCSSHYDVRLLDMEDNRPSEAPLDDVLSLLDSGAKALFIVTPRTLALEKGEDKRIRKMLFEKECHMAVVAFGRRRSNFLLLDGSKKSGNEVLMLDMEDQSMANGTLCFDIASFISGEEPSDAFGDKAMRVKRKDILESSYMLYPHYYCAIKPVEYRLVSDIDKELEGKYEELEKLCTFFVSK